MVLKVLAPMAGITDGEFCLKIGQYGFDMLTLGGYNIDLNTIKAGESILKRGRNEFQTSVDNYVDVIEKEAKFLKDKWDGLVSVNVRSTLAENIANIANLPYVDVIEINAHCRQKELINIGCGQELLKQTDVLFNLVEDVIDNADSKVSVKFRANVNGVDDLFIAKSLDDLGCDFIHIDAMKPGVQSADLELVKNICSIVDCCVIGNNSIVDIESANAMISTGCGGISIARKVLSGLEDFNLKDIL